MGVGVEGVGVAGVEHMTILRWGAPPGAPGAIMLDTTHCGYGRRKQGGGDGEELFGRGGWGSWLVVDIARVASGDEGGKSRRKRGRDYARLHKKRYRNRSACLRKSLCAVKGLG